MLLFPTLQRRTGTIIFALASLFYSKIIFLEKKLLLEFSLYPGIKLTSLWTTQPKNTKRRTQLSKWYNLFKQEGQNMTRRKLALTNQKLLPLKDENTTTKKQSVYTLWMVGNVQHREFNTDSNAGEDYMRATEGMSIAKRLCTTRWIKSDNNRWLGHLCF